jgi:hypothetical protein
MTEAFWDQYVWEAWALITPEWLGTAHKSPTGLDLYGLGEELHALTGDPNPFPKPPPAPPVVGPDETLRAALTAWLEHRHTSPVNSALVGPARDWLAQS